MKNKITLLDTEFAKFNGLEHGATVLMRYLISNKNILLSDTDSKTLYATKSPASTPITAVVNGILNQGLQNEFVLVNSVYSKAALPELLTIIDLTVDTKQMGSSNVLSSIKEFYNKVIIDVVPFTKQNRDGSLVITDVNDFHYQLVRGALVNSYYNTNGEYWLNPALIKSIAQIYAVNLSMGILKHYRLSVPELSAIQTVLTYFFLSRMCTNPFELIKQCDFLGNKFTILNVIDKIDETINNDYSQLTLSRMVDLLTVCGPDHMSNFNIDVFRRMTMRIGQSAIVSNIAVEYPPYFVYTILYTLAGNKTGLYFTLNQTKTLKPAEMLSYNLLMSRQFLPSVKSVEELSVNIEDSDTSLFEGYTGEKIEAGTEGILSATLVSIVIIGLLALITKKSMDEKELRKGLEVVAQKFTMQIMVAYDQYKKYCANIQKTKSSLMKYIISAAVADTHVDIFWSASHLLTPEAFTKNIIDAMVYLINQGKPSRSQYGNKLIVDTVVPLFVQLEFGTIDDPKKLSIGTRMAIISTAKAILESTWEKAIVHDETYQVAVDYHDSQTYDTTWYCLAKMPVNITIGDVIASVENAAAQADRETRS